MMTKKQMDSDDALLMRDKKILELMEVDYMLKKEFELLCKAIKDKSISRNMLIAYSDSYIKSKLLT